MGAIASLATAAIALTLALASAYGGRAVDALVLWLIDLVMGVPHIVLLLLISYALGRGLWGVAVGVALTHWPGFGTRAAAELMQAGREPHLVASRPLACRGCAWR